MARRASTLLKNLERLKGVYDSESSDKKIDLVRKLTRLRFKRAADVSRFHEILVFLRAFPDSPELLAEIESAIGAFSDRTDLRRFSEELADTGIAGTTINYRFFWETSRWLAKRFPGQIAIDWPEFENKTRFESFLHLFATFSETPALDELDFELDEWIQHLKGPDESDAEFLIRRFDALRMDPVAKEAFYEDIDFPIILSPGPGTPARTHAKVKGLPVVYQTEPLSRRRPSMRREIEIPPVSVRVLTPAEGQKFIDLARAAMVTRSRDLDIFAHGDKRDVRLIDCGDGLQFACIGAKPEYRLLLESVYGWITIKNGVPIGYVLASGLFGSTSIAYNIFDTYRGAESAVIYGRILSMLTWLFQCDAFAVDPYQLGHNNMEGLESGAWWFYYKLKFRPHDPTIKRVLRAELNKMKRSRRHRSSIDTLQKLTADYMFLYQGQTRYDVLGHINLGNIGMHVSRYLADRFGADRERGLKTCSREVAKLLGVRSFARFSPGERLAWERWSPLVLCLPGIGRWGRTSRRALVEVIRAKGGRHESDFVPLFDQHGPLRRAVLKLAKEE